MYTKLMLPTITVSIIALLVFNGPAVATQDNNHGSKEHHEIKADVTVKPYPLDKCLVSGEKLGGDMGEPFVIIHEDQEIKFCCKKCSKEFNKDPKKYLANLPKTAIPYPLDKCLVSGEKLGGDMGEPFVMIYKDQEIKFCCKKCSKKFNKDPEKYLAALPKPRPYPLKKCLISGEKLGGEMGEPFVMVYKGQEIRFCCKKCSKEFNKDPKKYLIALRKESSGEEKSNSGDHNNGDHNH